MPLFESTKYGHTVVKITFEFNIFSSWSKASIIPSTKQKINFFFKRIFFNINILNINS